MKNLLRTLLSAAFLSASASAVLAQVQLVPLTSFGTNGDGSIRPGERSYITGNGTNLYQRGMAYNPTTGHLLIANRSPVSAPTINIVDGLTGEDLGALPFEPGVLGGNTSFYLNKIGVADDGAFYAANLTSGSSATIQYALYRYDSETGGQTLVYFGDPSNGAATSSQSNGRWGDNMAVRGSGTNTQILIASSGTLVAILSPTDDTLTAFTAKTITTDASSGSMVSGISFGAGNSFWTKHINFALRRLTFDPVAGTAVTAKSFTSTTFPTRIGPILAMPSSNLLAGIEVAPGQDFVKLYDISNVDTAVFLDRETYFTNLDNGVSGGQICLGDSKLYALDADNGILAFSLVNTNENVAPSFFVQPASTNRIIGSNITLSSLADGIPTNIAYQWYFNQTNLVIDGTNASLTLTNAQAASSGLYSVVANNAGGSATSSVVTISIVPDSILYVYEPFNYTVDQRLTNFTLAPGQTWSTNGSTAADTLVTAGNLTIPGLAAPIGNSITNGGGGAAARLPMGGSQNSGAVYASFALRINAIGTSFTNGTSTGLMASFVNDAANDQQCRFVLRTNLGGKFNLGIGKAITAGVYATNEFSEGETIFIVMRYTFVTGSTTNDLADLWLNPSSATFGAAVAPTPTISAVVTNTDIASIDTWAFRQNSSGNTPANIQYDELRIANKWELVTPPASASVTLTAQKNGNNIVLSWPTAGSENYILESAPALGSPTTWTTVEEPVVIQGANNTVSLGLGTKSFFRLKK